MEIDQSIYDTIKSIEKRTNEIGKAKNFEELDDDLTKMLEDLSVIISKFETIYRELSQIKIKIQKSNLD
tara:strand:- start:16616 stop:16822 length:207 start_codon:yes stop_codon:yes gene_type:complete